MPSKGKRKATQPPSNHRRVPTPPPREETPPPQIRTAGEILGNIISLGDETILAIVKTALGMMDEEGAESFKKDLHTVMGPCENPKQDAVVYESKATMTETITKDMGTGMVPKKEADAGTSTVPTEKADVGTNTVPKKQIKKTYANVASSSADNMEIDSPPTPTPNPEPKPKPKPMRRKTESPRKSLTPPVTPTRTKAVDRREMAFRERKKRRKAGVFGCPVFL